MAYDLSIFETGDGADVVIKSNDAQLTTSLYNQVYLALFGGNVEQTTLEADNSPEQELRGDWWGNSVLFPNDDEAQFNSLFERRLKETPLTSQGRSNLEDTVKNDLKFLGQVGEVSVSVQLRSNDQLLLNVGIQEPERANNFVFLWDGTKGEVIESQII